MFELSNGFCMGGVSKGKINLVEISNVRVNGQSSYRMLTVCPFKDNYKNQEFTIIKQKIFMKLNIGTYANIVVS